MTTSKQVIKKESINFKLIKIELLDVKLIKPEKEDTEFKIFSFDIKLEFKVSEENNLIKTLVSIDILDEQNKLKLGAIESSCTFKPDKIDALMQSKATKKLNEDYIYSMGALSISVTRGIMFDQFKGTFLNNAYLPIIDLNLILPEVKTIPAFA
jgi:hypothetical protein